MQKLILSVEDNPDDVLILNRAFEKANTSARLEFLTDGEQALRPEAFADLVRRIRAVAEAVGREL